ncbi:hypothetical protein O1D97_13345 [Marinomonas sp. 15G1-11]|uniref:Uncharacterized protein n=1 Tax=Marinomonas phaeophyticola TaxID=3004091 RepID=A0ABT4JWE0_9GAMM|nr:hypothetical protein [Marinomonas sp. 15G1-11]MCZ2722566.1 hypothetical protein [Marinomonas sp. 15G1-11]
MSVSQSVTITKLEKIRTSWLPAVEFLFGKPVTEAEFIGFELNEHTQTPVTLFEDESKPFSYKIQMPQKSLTNEVLLLADVMHELCHGLYPLGYQGNNERKTTVLCEGAAIYGAVVALRQVFGDECVDEYLNVLQEKAFSYYDAFSYVAVLLADDPQAIKKLRERHPFLQDVTKPDFATADVKADVKIKDILLMTFRP